MSTTSYKQSAIRTITMERDAVDQLTHRIDAQFDKACELMLACKGV